MSKNQNESKPTDAEQPSPEGLSSSALLGYRVVVDAGFRKIEFSIGSESELGPALESVGKSIQRLDSGDLVEAIPEL